VLARERPSEVESLLDEETRLGVGCFAAIVCRTKYGMSRGVPCSMERNNRKFSAQRVSTVIVCRSCILVQGSSGYFCARSSLLEPSLACIDRRIEQARV
jgi:hypothetical protein